MKIVIIVSGGLDGEPEGRPKQPKTIHSKECDARRAAAALWRGRWPGHCTTCFGAGEVSYSYDPSAAGVGLGAGSMECSDPCSCVEEDRCPRCGSSLLGPVWRHPRRRLGAALSKISISKEICFAVVAGLGRVLAFAGVATSARQRAEREIARWLLLGKAGDVIYSLAERIAPPPDDDEPCASCGWAGQVDGDMMPADECYCEEAAYDDHQAQVAAGACCWRCEQPFSGERPGVQAKISVFGLRWLHQGCLFADERIVDSEN